MSSYDIAELSRMNEELKREINERKRAEAELEKRTRLLSTLLTVSNLVTSTLELRPMLEAILDQLKTILDYRGARLFIIENESLKVAAQRSFLAPVDETNYVFLYKQLAMGRRIIIEKKPVIIGDLQDDSALSQEFRQILDAYIEPDLINIRSWIGIPLIIKDKAIGLLSINHNEPNYYHPEHVELGIAFANQAAIEIENTRLYSETLKKADELKTMLSIQQAITSRLDLKSVLKLISDEARRLTHSDLTSVLLVDKEDLVFSFFSGEDRLNLLGQRIPINSTVLGSYLLRGKSAIFKHTPDHHNANRDIIEKIGAKSYLIVPLISGSKSVGLISASSKMVGEFDAEDERILNMFASSAVIGIENARMYEEEQRRHRVDEQHRHVAEGLRDILAILNSNWPLDEILEFIIQGAAALMETDAGALFRLQKDSGILTVRASCGLASDFISDVTIPVDASALGKVVVERKPVVLTNINDMLPKDQGIIQALKRQFAEGAYNGLIALPIICKNEVFGCIVLFMKEKCCFTGAEIELATTYASQAALAIDNAQLRVQAEQAAVNAERSRLARDLHDAVTQTLFSASLIAEVLPKIWDKNQQEGRKRLDEVRQLTRGALAEMRTLLLELRPAALVEASIEELLKHLTEATVGRARLDVALKIEGTIGLPTDVKIGLYRVAQEALNNVAKHSGANKATVSLTCSSACQGCTTDTVELMISDDGRGFNPKDISGEHLGVGIMKERAEAIGAELSVESSLGEGTDIIIRWTNKQDVKD